jgi:hypothetical protein
MFGEILKGFIDKEQIIKDYMGKTLEQVAEELDCPFDNIFIMIKPIKSDSSEDFKAYLYQILPGSAPKLIREMAIKEFVEHE